MVPFSAKGREAGWIEVISGSMFSGKSEELIRRIRRSLIAGRKVQVFKSVLDDRYEGVSHVCSHNGAAIEAVPVHDSREIYARVDNDTKVVAIDEAQFFDSDIVGVVNAIAQDGRQVIVVGTDMDFRGDVFGPMGTLLAIAEKVDKLHAVCVKCGAEATRNQRLVDGSPAPAEAPTVQVGASEGYEARCRGCHEVPGKLGDAEQLGLEGIEDH